MQEGSALGTFLMDVETLQPSGRAADIRCAEFWEAAFSHACSLPVG